MTTTDDLRPARRPAKALRPLIGLISAVAVLGLTGCDPLPGYAGICTGDDALTGTTVVVDFQDLDGNDGRPAKTIVRCSPNAAPGTPRNGVETLQDAGIDVTGVDQWGLGFICRLNDRPAADEPLPLDNDPGYLEACRVTPPAAGYWSYWHADGSGEDWVYSNFGALNRTVIPGGFEGWSFSMNAGPTTNPVPRVEPSNPAVDPDAPQAALSVSALERKITLGQSTQLVWETTNTTSLLAAANPGAGGGNWSGTITPLSGSRTITPTERGEYAYLLLATGPKGSVVASTTLIVE